MLSKNMFSFVLKDNYIVFIELINMNISK